MKKVHIILFPAAFFLLLGSCKKESTAKVSGTSSLTIVNGLVGNSFLYTNFNGDKSNGEYYSQMNSVDYGYANFYNSYSGQQKLGLYQLPDTNANSQPVIGLTLDLPVNSIHTLFLMGTPSNPDYLLTTDQLPYHAPADSAMGIRFINISAGSAPITVNISGQAYGSEVKTLSYKTVTGFKDYYAGSSVSSYTFEFRDKITGMLLGSCLIDGVNNNGSPSAPNIRLYRNYTIALVGVSGGLATNNTLIVDEDMHY